jgi:hypothetical protein
MHCFAVLPCTQQHQHCETDTSRCRWDASMGLIAHQPPQEVKTDDEQRHRLQHHRICGNSIFRTEVQWIQQQAKQQAA